MLKNTLIILLLLVMTYNVGVSQCMSVDISIDRECVDGQGVITILTSDIDSVTYSIDGGTTFSDNPTFQNLNIGTYNIVVQDTTGCLLTFTETIEPFLEIESITITSSCNSLNSGEIVLDGIYGNPLYQYSIDGGQSYYTDSTFTDIGVGNYQVVIKDSYGCEEDSTIAINAYPAISPTIVSSDEQCNQVGTGSVNVTFSTGMTYGYSLNGGALTSGVSYNNSSLNTGQYNLEITDVNNCTTPFQFQINSVSLDNTINITQETCNEQNGSLQITGLLGVTPYEYSIDNGVTYSNSNVFGGLTEGNYIVLTRDAIGCIKYDSINLPNFGGVDITLSTADSSVCSGQNADLSVAINAGTNISYEWDNSLSNSQNHVVFPTTTTTYTVIGTDLYNCKDTSDVTINVYNQISPTIVSTNEVCNGSSPGTVNITFTNGANYDFSLDGGAIVSGTAYNNSNLATGFYVINITDQNGCTSPFQFQVGADLVDDSVVIDHEYCHYGDGNIEVFGYLGQAPYEYSIDNGTTYLPTGTFNNLSAGYHVVLIKDATGCVKTDSVYMTNFGGVVAIPSVDDTVCIGSSAIVSVSHNAGVNANYEWNNGLNNQQSHVVSPTTTTTYSVIVTDDYGCKDTTATSIYVETIPDVVLSDNQLQACIGDSIQLTAYGANNYVWSTGDTTDVMNYVAIGYETITVTGYNGQCSDSEQMLIVIKPSPTAVASANTYSVNTGGSIFFFGDSSISSTTNWNFGDGFTSQESNPYHEFNFPGAYYVVLTTEMGDCEATDTLLIYVGTVSVNELNEENVLVYPNPASDYFNIETKQKGELQLMDVKGQLIKQQLILEGQNKIDISTIPKGVYLAIIQTKEKYYQLKVLKE